MKTGSISVLNATSAIIGTAVVDTTAPVLRLGSVVDAAIGADPSVVNFFLLDPQAGKVCVLLDANRAAIAIAVRGATGKANAEIFTGGDETTKAKTYTANDGVAIDATLDTVGAFPDAETALMVAPRPALTVSGALNAIEDALVNVDSPFPILVMVSQTAKTIEVVSFDTNAHAAAAYALGIAASTKQAEFLSTPAPTGGVVKEYFA